MPDSEMLQADEGGHSHGYSTHHGNGHQDAAGERSHQMPTRRRSHRHQGRQDRSGLSSADARAVLEKVDSFLAKTQSEADLRRFTPWGLSDPVEVTTFTDGGVLPLPESSALTATSCEASTTKFFNIPMARTLRNADGKRITPAEIARAKLGLVQILRCGASSKNDLRQQGSRLGHD